MNERLEAVLTEAQPREAGEALLRAALSRGLVNGTNLVEASNFLKLVMGQTAFETGHWGSSDYAKSVGLGMWCWNFGNVKAHSDWEGAVCFYTAGERFTRAQMKQAKSQIGERTDASGPDFVVLGYNAKSNKYQVKAFPDHPVARFRAFLTLIEGALGWFDKMLLDYPKALEVALTGHPLKYAEALLEGRLSWMRYYSDTPEHYAQTLVSVSGRYASMARTIAEALLLGPDDMGDAHDFEEV